MKKALIVSTVSRQFYLFEQANIEVLKSLGYEVHGAANFDDVNERLDVLDIIRHHFDIQRSPFKLKNIKAYKQLKKMMKSENYDMVHCHSPVGGVLARLAAKSVGISTVIYTAHGFHFFRGASMVNWVIYYTIEKFLSRYTDVLVTINQEDYYRAKRFKAKKVIFVPGIGVDTKRFSGIVVDRAKKLKELGLSNNAFVILSVGELNKNKNHEVVIKALTKIINQNVYYIICGRGNKENYLKQLAISLGIDNNVRILGFRNDMDEIYKVADIFALPSYREGLSVSLMEAMAAGLPVICSNIRGNIDLIDNGKAGYLLSPRDADGFAKSILKLIDDTELCKVMGNRNSEKVAEFDKDIIKNKMKKIYEDILSGN